MAERRPIPITNRVSLDYLPQGPTRIGRDAILMLAGIGMVTYGVITGKEKAAIIGVVSFTMGATFKGLTECVRYDP